MERRLRGSVRGNFVTLTPTPLRRLLPPVPAEGRGVSEPPSVTATCSVGHVARDLNPKRVT